LSTDCTDLSGLTSAKPDSTDSEEKGDWLRSDLPRRSGTAAKHGSAGACHLEAARLHLARGQKREAGERLAAGRALIDETSYHRRDAEADEIEGQLG